MPGSNKKPAPRLLPEKFFERSAIAVARELLGKFLVRRYRGCIIRMMITETEAYIGPHDLAAHSSKGLTPRTKVMFGPPGRWYVYFTYGMHWMLNVVTGKTGYPSAVLFRGLRGVTGPARLTKHLHIDKALNAKAAQPSAGLWIEDGGIKIPASRVRRSPRIGVDYAGPVWAVKPYRFYIDPLYLTKLSAPDILNEQMSSFAKVSKKSNKPSGGG